MTGSSSSVVPRYSSRHFRQKAAAVSLSIPRKSFTLFAFQFSVYDAHLNTPPVPPHRAKGTRAAKNMRLWMNHCIFYILPEAGARVNEKSNCVL